MQNELMSKPGFKGRSSGSCICWLACLLTGSIPHIVAASSEGVIDWNIAGKDVSVGKYGIVMSFGQAGPVGVMESNNYGLKPGYVPVAELAPALDPPVDPKLTGATEDQAFEVSATSLINLLGVSSPDGLNYEFEVTATAGVLRQGASIVTSATLGQAGSVHWVPPSNQAGNINALAVVMKRGEYPSTSPVALRISVDAVNDGPTGTVTIAGEAKEDEVLTASNNLADEDGLGDISYQWKRAGAVISGATASSYTLVQADVGKALSVVVSYTDGQGNIETVTSGVTATVVESTQLVTQFIALVQGWNLVSLYAQPDDMKPSTVFSGHFDVIEEMRTLQGVFNTSWPDFLNTIQQLDLAGSYWIKSNTARSGITVTGAPPTSTDISLAQGWNLIGFPSVGAQETGILFQSLSDQNKIERIIGTGEFYTFDSNALFNTLGNLKPGDGYWVKMHEAATLTVNSVSANGGQNGGRALGKAGGKTKLAELKQHLVTYPSVPAICITEVRANGKQAPDGSLLAAYVGDELRGVQAVRFQDGKMIVPIVVQASQPAQVRFRMWHAGLAKWFEVAERIEADSGDTLGMDGNGPVVLNVTAPWPSAPGLALSQQPLRLLVRHESDRKFVVEQSRNLKEWVLRWQLTGTGEWRELLIQTTVTREYFRVRALD